jgi:riboflavin kinase / FMN adenylyltransferase
MNQIKTNPRMRILRDINHLPGFRNPTVTLGTFDGVHLGHVEILNTLKQKASEINGETVLITFWPHPRMVLQPEDDTLRLLNTIEEKIEILENYGLDNLVIIPFTEALSAMTHQEFIEKILVHTFHVKSLVIGHDHHFGKNREGNYAQLEHSAPLFNFELTQVPALQINGVNVSSSRIRHALESCETEKANQLLGYTYQVSGTVVRGMNRGKELGFPTANIKTDDHFKLIPCDGVYAVEAIYNGISYQGMASIGFNPTFGDTGKTLEVNIFNFNTQIYNEKITIKFWHFLRKEVKFANRKELVQQLHADEKETRNFFINL